MSYPELPAASLAVIVSLESKVSTVTVMPVFFSNALTTEFGISPAQA